MKILICKDENGTNSYEIYDITGIDINELLMFITNMDKQGMGSEYDPLYAKRYHIAETDGDIDCEKFVNVLMNQDVIYHGNLANYIFFQSIPSLSFLEKIVELLGQSGADLYNNDLYIDLRENYQKYMSEATIKEIIE